MWLRCIEEFRHYIDGLEVYVDTDHQNITWLSRTKGRTDRLGRWILRLSEFRAKIAWRKGKYMDIADCMSRNPHVFVGVRGEVPGQGHPKIR